ncbi:MAG: hypothetical protein HOH33_01255 [Verrucomicrobia bacterium]|jgi:hypothetical protein|nr:hypothetical protein [Opitutae bacterium]MBT5925225.1 hypothetical protein [Verrucomicrobiota bacterium]
MNERKQRHENQNLGELATDVISSINVHDSESWQNKNFLTIDIDWAHDEILADAIGPVEEALRCYPRIPEDGRINWGKII